MSAELDALIELHRYAAMGKQPPVTLKFGTEPLEAINAAIGALLRAEQRLVTLEAVRAWYADPAVYLRVPAYTQIAADKGERARVAAPDEGARHDGGA